MNTPDHLAQTLATDVRISHDNLVGYAHEVVAIDCAAKKVDAVNLKARCSLPYDKLIIATGSSPAVPPIPGLRHLYNNGRLVTLRTIDGPHRTTGI
jgi:NAD(P)H-nitrite reductase large subunit